MRDNSDPYDHIVFANFEYFPKAPPQTRFTLGTIYEKGKGVYREINKMVVAFYRRDAGLGHAKATYNLGWMYEKEIGVEKSDSEAERYYKKTIKLAKPDTRKRLANLYYRRGENTLKTDEQKGCEYFEQAAQQGDAHAK